MAETKLELNLPLGRLIIHPAVVVGMVAQVLGQVEGVRLWRGGGLMGVFGGEEGIHVSSRENEDLVDVEIRIGVMFDYPVHEVAQGVQQAIREALEGLVGAKVGRVDVYVQEVFLPEVTVEGENAET